MLLSNISILSLVIEKENFINGDFTFARKERSFFNFFGRYFHHFQWTAVFEAINIFLPIFFWKIPFSSFSDTIHFEKWQICSQFPKSKKVSYPADYQFIDKFFNQTSNCQEQKVFKRLSHLTGAKTIERLNWITISKAFDTKCLSKQP